MTSSSGTSRVTTPRQQTGSYDPRRCAANAQAFAGAERLVAVVGPWDSACAQIEVPIANRAPDGPLAMVSPSSTSPNLTRGGELALPPPFGFRGEPEVYYPTGERNLLRLAARSDLLGVALAQLARDLGLRSVYLVNDAPDGPGDVLYTDGFERAAPELGVGVAGVEGTGDQRGLRRAGRARRTVRSRRGRAGHLPRSRRRAADDAAQAARTPRGADGGRRLPAALLRRWRLAGEAAEGLYVASPELPPKRSSSRPKASASCAGSVPALTRASRSRAHRRPRPCWRRSPAPTAPARRS